MSTAASAHPVCRGIHPPGIAQRSIYRCLDEQTQLLAAGPGLDDTQRAERAERLARLAELQVTWWAVLARWAYGTTGTVPVIFARAAGIAHDTAESDARFWAETARFWRDRAAGLPGDDGTGVGRGCA